MSRTIEEQQHSPADLSGQANLLDALRRGAYLITPHPRAARVWAARYDADRVRRGENSWQAANILPWGAWTSSLWNAAVVHGSDSRVLLNALQEKALWSGILEAPSQEGLVPAKMLVPLCTSANRLLGSYDTKGRFASGLYQRDAQPSDTNTFARWFAEFEAICRSEALLPASHLEIELAVLITAGKLEVGGEYLLCGFDSMTPAQDVLLAAVRSVGAQINHVTPEVERREAPTLVRAGSPRQELQACALWVRGQLEENPSTSLAIVVPDFDAARPELERELRAAVAPGTADVTRPDMAAPYEFASSRTLRQLPMVTDAMLVLRWCGHEVSLDDAGTVLRSRHLSLAASPEQGAELEDRVLRRLPFLRRTVALRQAADALARDGAGSRLATLEKEAQTCRSGTYAYAWFAAKAHDLLQHAGWPGTLHSDEFQVADRWNEALDQLASLNLLGKRVDFATFLLELEAVVADTRFAQENRAAPVQIILVREATGATVDSLWFLHADSTTWPARPALHPLLPRRLQNELGMPGTDVLRDEASASATLDLLARGSGSVRFSYTGTVSGVALEPAPLVEHLVEKYSGRFTDAEAPPEPWGPATLLMTEHDEEPLPALPDDHVSGGVSILTAQAQCGFRAFAEKRLFAKPADEVDAGFSPGERGDQVHKVLQAFWDEAKDQSRLIKLSKPTNADGTSERDRMLKRYIAQVFRSTPHAWDSAYLHVQQQRLFRLLSSWLDFEATRPPFEVLHMEKEIKNVAVGPLHITMRVDRIDHVTSSEGDGIVLIDYKTGAASSSKWVGDRPDEPQLPIYAAAGVQAAGMANVDGMAFGLVKVGKDGMKLDGLAGIPNLLKAKSRGIDFTEQTDTWRTDLERLATAFAEGDAAVKPKEYPKTCDGCGQRMLCRVNAASLLQLDDLDPDMDEDEVAAW